MYDMNINIHKLVKSYIFIIILNNFVNALTYADYFSKFSDF